MVKMTNKFTKEQIIKQIIECKGFVSQIAKNLNCKPGTVRNYIKRFPELKEEIDEAREAMVDYAESKLLQNIKEGKEASIFFYLKTQGRSRGYGDSSNIDLTSAGKELKREIILIEHPTHDDLKME